MTWNNKPEIGLKEDSPIRKDNLPESQVSPTTQADLDAEETAEAAATTDGMPPAPLDENDALGG